MEKPARPADEPVPPPEVITGDLAPENHNAEQEDEEIQAQTLADEALGRRSAFEGADTERAGSEDEAGGIPDVVDHMKQMVTSGRIDMAAFRGERSDDDEDGMLGEAGLEDDFPRGAQ